MLETTLHQYTVGIIGCGRVSLRHLRAIRDNRSRLKLTALADPNVEQAEALAQDHGRRVKRGADPVRVFTSLYELIEAVRGGSFEQPDIIAVTTPSGTHYELTRAAIGLGSNLVLEKPMSLDLNEARELKQLAEERQVTIIMGHIYRYMPLVSYIRRDIMRGGFGQILSGDVKVRWGHGQAYYDAAGWRGTWEQDGGVLMNQTIHALDLMCWLMNDRVEAVSGRIERFTHRMEAEDFGCATLLMASGAVCQVEGTTCTSEERRVASFFIMAEKGQIECGLHAGMPYIHVYDEHGRRIGFRYIRRQAGRLFRRDGAAELRRVLNPHTGIYYDLIGSLDGKGSVRADAASGVDAVENILAIYQSASLGGDTVTLPVRDFTLTDMAGHFEGREPWLRGRSDGDIGSLRHEPPHLDKDMEAGRR